MPYYDYKCMSCGFIFEIQKQMTSKLEPTCPKCGSASQRVFSAPRMLRSDKNILNDAGSEQSGSCSTCTSGVCSTCGGR